ncbi:MAG: hypothetical protein U5L96_04000 [Owenweeksia sp.]|nr:hypothetical protein [Owenweeksia sp.]
MQLGLIGKSLAHSFSQRYFQEKFANNGLGNYSYENFELAQIQDFPALLKKHPQLRGLNVTIPYKETIIPFLDELSPEARAIGAVNTLNLRGGLKKGYNTDQYGFCESLKPRLQKNHSRALILGTGRSLPSG